LLIPVEGPVEELHIYGPDGASLRQLQEAVGGYIEAVDLPDFIRDARRAVCYVNEEGKLTGLPFNGRATDLLVPGVGLMWGDSIAGPMVVCGFDADDGSNTDIPAGVERRIRLIESEAGPAAPMFEVVWSGHYDAATDQLVEGGE
jgi:hypothetical protein